MNTAIQPATSKLADPINGAPITARSWSVASAYEYCERIARSHYENFPVGSVLVPKPLRKHFYSIYAFARTADDFADEGYTDGYTEAERLACLEQWRAMLRASGNQRAQHPVFIALAETRAEFDLPIALFEDLLSAFMQDVTMHRYQTFDELRDYCRRSANPIGRLILLLFGHRDEQWQQQSDAICTALQLANHWQDVSIDLRKDRIYLPAEDLARFGVSYEDLQQSRMDERFKRLMQYEVEQARALFVRGKPLCVAARGRLGLELRAVWLGGTTILNRIAAADFDVFTRRPVIRTADKLRILLAAVSKGLFRHQR